LERAGARSYATSEDKLIEAVKRMKEALAKLK